MPITAKASQTAPKYPKVEKLVMLWNSTYGILFSVPEAAGVKSIFPGRTAGSNASRMPCLSESYLNQVLML